MADFSDSSTPIDLHIPEYTENSVELTTPYLDDYDHGDPEPILIKGSWEAILQEAQQLASRQDDEAIPLFDKLVRRIGKMSVAQRVANDERLRAVIAACPVVNADGQSVVTASRILRRPLPERVAGIDLFVELVKRSALARIVAAWLITVPVSALMAKRSRVSAMGSGSPMTGSSEGSSETRTDSDESRSSPSARARRSVAMARSAEAMPVALR